MAHRSERRTDVLIALGLAAVVFLAFVRVLRNGFVNYDDPIYVTANPLVQEGLALERVVEALTYTEVFNWHPMTWWSIMLDVELFGQNPAGHHLTGLLLHMANTVLLFLVLRRMTGSLWPSAFVALLFGIHPLHVEPVAWVSSRKDVLSGFFFILMLLAYHGYVRKPGIVRGLVVGVLFALGLMAKAMLVTAPFVLFLFDYWPLRRFSEAPFFSKAAFRQNARLVLEKPHLFAIVALVSVVTSKAGQNVVSFEDYPLHYRMANTSVAYAAYMIQTVWPSKLVPFYQIRGESILFWRGAISSVVLLGIFVVAFRTRKRCPALLVGWLLFVGMLMPVNMLIYLVGSASRADRYTYLPLIGLFIMLAWGIPAFLPESPRTRVGIRIAAIAALAALFCCTVRQVGHWRNSITLFEHTVKAYPNNALAHNNLGIALDEAGRKVEAVAHYAEAVRLFPYYPNALCNLGTSLLERGLVDDAIAPLAQAVTLKPAYAKAHLALGAALARKGALDMAIYHFEQTIALEPADARAHANLGAVLLQMGDHAAALEALRTAVKLDPNDMEAAVNIALALAGQGERDNAAAHLETLLRRLPDAHPVRSKVKALLGQLARE